MHRTFIRRVVVLTGLALMLLTAGLAAPAHADPVCAGVTVTGTATGTKEIGPYCYPYPYAVLCSEPGVGLRPTAEVSAFVCVPI